MLLLASRTLFISLIAVVALVVLLCLWLSAMLYFKSARVKKTLEADVIKKELYRRETDVVVKIFHDKPEESKREALINELRRIKSAELLIDEIIKAEKAERGIEDNHSAHPGKGDKKSKHKKAPDEKEKAPQAPATQESGNPAPAANAQPETNVVKPVEKGAQYTINADKGNPPSAK